MSQPPDDQKPVRRFGSRDRKSRIDPQPPLFGPDDPPLRPESNIEPDFLDLPEVQGEDDALAALRSLPPDEVRPLRITPSEERYPPLAPAPPAQRPRAQKTAVRRNPRARRYNLLTFLFFLLTVLLIAYYGLIWVDPQTPLNPLAPPIQFIPVTATPGAPQVAPVLNPSATPDTSYPFVLNAAVVYAPNANDRGCNWSSIAGTVTDSGGDALDGYRLRISGDGLNETVFSGAARTFGPGGYELPLADAPVADQYTIQLFSPEGAPLSDVVTVETRATCEENVALVNFGPSPDS